MFRNVFICFVLVNSILEREDSSRPPKKSRPQEIPRTPGRTAAFDMGEAHGTAISVVIILSACITGLGLMNLVVGILCNTAFKLESRQSRTQGAERLVSQQEALDLFRQQLMKHGPYLLRRSNRLISKEEFVQAMEAEFRFLMAVNGRLPQGCLRVFCKHLGTISRCFMLFPYTDCLDFGTGIVGPWLKRHQVHPNKTKSSSTLPGTGRWPRQHG